MHRLKIYSGHGDLLELNTKTPARPTIRICEICVDGHMEPWHPQWENLPITDFVEDYQTVKDKVIEFYKSETKSSQDGPVVKRIPGEAEIYSEFDNCNETWNLRNCRVVGCDFLDGEEKVVLELAFDGANYDCQEKNGCCGG